MKQDNGNEAVAEYSFSAGLPDDVESLLELGYDFQFDDHDYEAEECFKKAFAIVCKKASYDDPEVWSVLDKLVRQYRMADLCEDVADAALLAEVSEAEEGLTAQALASRFHSLASGLRDNGRYAEADKLYALAQAGWSNLYGDEFPEVGGILHDRAETAKLQGYLDRAVFLGLQALWVWKETFDAGHLEVAGELEFLAQVHEAGGRPDEAAPFVKWARAIRVNESEPAQIALRERENAERVWSKIEDEGESLVSDCSFALIEAEVAGGCAAEERDTAGETPGETDSQGANEILQSLGLADEDGVQEAAGTRKARIAGDKIAYFDFNGVPTYVKNSQVPIKVVDGKEIPHYGWETFTRESVSITRDEFVRMCGTGAAPL